jgi:chromate transporter
MIAILIQLAALFGLLSILAFGGGAGVIPDMQRAAVEHYHWMTGREFLDLFAISRAAPGPGSLIVVLIGQKAAGLAGAAVSFVAMFVPSCLLVYVVAHFWHRAGRAPWRKLLERALSPVAIGMTFASGLSLVRGTEHEWLAYTITLTSTAAFAFTGINPVLLLASGGVAVLLAGG